MVNLESMVKVDWSNQRVLTTAQLAACYNCSSKNIHDNFARTKEHFIEGVHYFKIEESQMEQFRQYAEKIGLQISPMTRTMYLWTERGCLRHCKMLNTKEAWYVFGDLEQTYFEVKELPAPVEVPKLPEKKACVYAFLMKTSLVKVGYSSNVKKRKEAFAGVVRSYSSPEVSVEEARDIERLVKEKFYIKKVEGEFFSVTFEEAVFEIKKYFTLEQPEHLDDARLKLLVELCAVPLDCPEKLLLFKETANLLLGRSLF